MLKMINKKTKYLRETPVPVIFNAIKHAEAKNKQNLNQT